VETGWLETSARATTAAAGCLLSVAPPSPSPTSFAKFAEDFLLHGFCNKLVIYFVFFSQQQQHSRFGFSCCGFLVVELLLLLFVCLFVCFWVLQFVA